jgi:hypothetical protein
MKILCPALLLSALMCLFSSCTKTNTDPFFDVVPRIELLDVSATSFVEFSEQITLTLRYEDGDGDLGNPDSEVNSIFVQDSRLSMPDEFYLQPLAPEDALPLNITGTLNVLLAPTFLLGNGSSETLVYSVYLVDRAGNKSNVVQTPAITVTRQ